MGRWFGSVLLGLLCLPPASAEVRIWGSVYCWHPELIPPVRPWYDAPPETEVPGQGTYVPLEGLLVQVEFGAITPDPTGYTGTDGMYAATYRNPLDGHFDVDLEIRDELLLGSYDTSGAASMPRTPGSELQVDGRCTVRCNPEQGSVWQYNGQTDNARVLLNTECAIDAWIGGPKNNVTFWAYYDTDGRKTLTGLHACLAVRQAYQWLVSRGIPAHHIWRDTNLAYPQADNAHYQPLALPPGIGNIYLDARRLYADQFDSSDARVPEQIVLNWQYLQCTAIHEYAHKVMHDVYWALPQSFAVWQGSSHTATTCKNAELAWKEGWAEFLAAAVRGSPTVDGRPTHSLLGDEEHLEQSWVPDEAPYNSETALPGNLEWRGKVPANLRAINELENAAVLWDVYDPTGPEFFPEAEQIKAQAAGWPGSVRWYDRLEDPNLSRIWQSLTRHNPDCLIDEGDLLEDSFWHYWLLHDYGSHPFLTHGLKAVVANRGIYSSGLPQHKPEVQVALSADRTTATLTITEADAEDRSFLSYNLAYGGSTPASKRIRFERDEALTCGAWTNNRATATIPLPNAESYESLIVLVHDDIGTAFAHVGPGAGGTGGGDAGYRGRRVDWKGFIRVEKGGKETEWHAIEAGMAESRADLAVRNGRIVNDWFPGGGLVFLPPRNLEFQDAVHKCRRWSVKGLFGTGLTHTPDLYTVPVTLRGVPAELQHLFLGFVRKSSDQPYPDGQVIRRTTKVYLLDKDQQVLSTRNEEYDDRGGPYACVVYFPIGEVQLGQPNTTP